MDSATIGKVLATLIPASLNESLDQFEFVLYFVEHLDVVVAFTIGLYIISAKSWKKPVICLIPMMVVTLILMAVGGSYKAAHENGYDLTKPSLRQALEIYIEEGSPNEFEVERILNAKVNAPVFGWDEVNYLVKDLLRHTFFHSDHDNQDVNMPIAYNKGNDWFRWTLGEPMVYTSGIYKTGKETLAEAQAYKLDYVANAINLTEGDTLLDIGCGWGRLAKHMTEKYGAKVTGVSLSTEQLKFGMELNKGNGANLLLQDGTAIARDRPELIPEGGFDAVTQLEMAEHVGIRRYTSFIKGVRKILKDDGTLYWQVAGLRRDWQFQDLIWGMFMGEHVFPGADASTPMGWVTTHLERGGFEVQRVQNLGSHYSITLQQWCDEWRAAKTEIVAKWGEKAFRRWEVFLAWSSFIAKEGQSTVYMITATKSGGNGLTATRGDAPASHRVKTQQHLAPQLSASVPNTSPGLLN